MLVIGKQNLSPVVRRLDIRAEHLVARLRPGQFVTVMAGAVSRRVPMNVYEIDPRRKSFSLVFAEDSPEMEQLASLRIHDTLFAVTGPYGQPVVTGKVGTVLFVGEETGVASLVALCRAFRQTGNKIVGLAGFAARRTSTLENQMRLNCAKFQVMYRDGRQDRRGDVMVPLHRALAEEKPSCVYAHASMNTMQDVARACAEAGVPVKVNVMDALASEPFFSETRGWVLGGELYVPARDGVWLDAARIDMPAFVRRVDAFREYVQCRKSESERFAGRSVWGRLAKFIWG